MTNRRSGARDFPWPGRKQFAIVALSTFFLLGFGRIATVDFLILTHEPVVLFGSLCDLHFEFSFDQSKAHQTISSPFCGQNGVRFGIKLAERSIILERGHYFDFPDHYKFRIEVFERVIQFTDFASNIAGEDPNSINDNEYYFSRFSGQLITRSDNALLTPRQSMKVNEFVNNLRQINYGPEYGAQLKYLGSELGH